MSSNTNANKSKKATANNATSKSKPSKPKYKRHPSSSSNLGPGLLGMPEKNQNQSFIDPAIINLIHREGGQEAVMRFFQQLGPNIVSLPPPSNLDPLPSSHWPVPPKPKAPVNPKGPASSTAGGPQASSGSSKQFQQKEDLKDLKQPPSKASLKKAKPSAPLMQQSPSAPVSTASYAAAAAAASPTASTHGYNLSSRPTMPNPPAGEPARKMSPVEDVIRRINDSHQKVLVLMRGCPGSGKTTLANKLKRKGVVLSADDFFMINGKYEYDPLKLPEAHSSVRFKTLEFMQRGVTPIIIDNTNLESWEMEPYMLQAVKLRYFVALIEPETSWRYNARVLTRLNTHQVPRIKIDEMLLKFDHKVNVHMLRKLIQPKIDIYKQQRAVRELQNEAQKAVNDHMAARLPSVSEILDIHPSKPPAMTTTPSRRPLRSKGPPPQRSPYPDSESSGDDDYDRQKSNAGTILQPTNATESSAKISNQNLLLSPSMMDLMDIEFVESKQTNDWKVPPFPGTMTETSTSPASSSSSSKIKAEALINLMTDSLVSPLKQISLNNGAKDESSLNDETATPKPKSLMETGLDAIRREDAVRALKAHFSDVPTEDLDDLVVRCDGDVHWAANLLLDSGYKWIQKSEGDDREHSVVTASNADTDSDDGEEGNDDDDSGEDEEEEDDDDEGSEILNGQASPEDQDSSKLTMRIDPIFAMQLEHLFGPVGFHVATGSYFGNDLNLEIDMKTARKVHSLWSQSLARKFQREEDTLKEMLKDENYAERLQVAEDANIAAKLNAEERDPNFPALTTEALLLEAKTKYIEITTDGLASKIKRHQLYEMFPKIDRKAIDNVFNAHDGNLTETKRVIEASFSPHELPGLVVAPEMMEECENAWMKIAQQESLRMFDEKNQNEVMQAVEDPGYDDLRAEATVHYHRRQECFERAQEAHGKNMGAVASFYSQQGHLHSQKLYEANKRAKEIILTKTNANLKGNTLDLHMLYVQEAMETLTNFLSQKKKEFKMANADTMILTLITGKGTHSEHGLPRIKPAVVEFLHRHNYIMCDVNGGVIEVKLTRYDLE